MDAVAAYLEANQSRHCDELFALLRIPSVSADSRHSGDVQRAAEFVAERLTDAGVPARVVATAGHPLVVGEWLGAPGAPTVLFYGHYDVQPPDPLDLWHSPPFEPQVRDGNIFARGASDDKGQMYAHIKAVEAWLKTHGRLPVNVRFLIEGEEEVGGAAVAAHLHAHRHEFACDYAVISDTSMQGPDRPAITCSLRGIAYFEIILRGPDRDLHSGTFGGSVQNPANALCEILAALKDARGRILLPGFYDDVLELSAAERSQLGRVARSDEEYRQEVGAPALFGEAGYSTLERRTIRPTCDINGLYGGYHGEGAKTVLPAFAGAKVSFRLVPHQDPAKVTESFRAFVEARRPPGVALEVRTYHGAPGVVVPTDSPGVQAAVRALRAAFGVEPVFIREGGSIPIVTTIKETLGADTLLIGFGLPDDNLHSPNEKFALQDFCRGITTIARLLDELRASSK